MAVDRFDAVVVGAGVFGLYAADVLARRGSSVLVVDIDESPGRRASYVNQARVHNGYHYPRSVYTALQANAYLDRFANEFPDAVNAEFSKIYAVAAAHSHTHANAFLRFCQRIEVPTTLVDPGEYFRPGTVELAVRGIEYAFDGNRLLASLMNRLRNHDVVETAFGVRVTSAVLASDGWILGLDDDRPVRAGRVINATYAGVNAINGLLGIDPLSLQYELCEVALVRPAPALEGVGITVMDGPFFSIMPFGNAGLHTLTAVDFTPRRRSTGTLPTFACQRRRRDCRPDALATCDGCYARPESAFPFMDALARRFLLGHIDYEYDHSKFAVKTVLSSSAVDDARPLMVIDHPETREEGQAASATTVFSGKINTFFDLEVLL